MSVSSIVLNSQMAKYDDMAVAGVGVAMKVTMITGMICIGFVQGIQAILHKSDFFFFIHYRFLLTNC